MQPISARDYEEMEHQRADDQVTYAMGRINKNIERHDSDGEITLNLYRNGHSGDSFIPRKKAADIIMSRLINAGWDVVCCNGDDSRFEVKFRPAKKELPGALSLVNSAKRIDHCEVSHEYQSTGFGRGLLAGVIMATTFSHVVGWLF